MNICPKCQGFRGFVNDSQGRKPCLCDLEAQLSASNEDADKWCKLANERWNQIASMETRLASWRELFGAKEGESPEQCRAIWQEALNEQDRLRAQLAQLKAPSPGEQQRQGGDWPNDNGRVVDAAGNAIEAPTERPDDLCHICGIPNDKLGGDFCSAAHGQPPAAPRQEPPQEIPQWAKEAVKEITPAPAWLSDEEIKRRAAIILRHAPPPAASVEAQGGELREAIRLLTIERDNALSAMRARDTIGMSREEYHKAKKALAENETLRTHLASERQAKVERGEMVVELQDKLDALSRPVAPVAPVGELVSIYRKIEANARSLRETAMEGMSASPPVGYDELEGRAVEIADECCRDGLLAMQTAVLNFLCDQMTEAQKDRLAAQSPTAPETKS